MKYLAFILRVEIMAIGVIMMVLNPVVSTPPFMSGAAFLSIGVYLTLLGYYREEFSKSLFKKEAPKPVKKKGFFSK